MQWQQDGNSNGQRDSNATATMATAMEGVMVTAMATAALVGAKAMVMEGVTVMQWQKWQ